jgi:hypothetical protein
MKEELIELGFKETNSPYWLEYVAPHFYIHLCIGGYFFIYTNNLGKMVAPPYDYKGVEKLKALINAHEEYFK